MPLKPVTIKYYNQLYNKLLKNGFDPTKDHYNNCMKILDDLNLKYSTKSNYLKSLLFKNNENIICLSEDDKKNISNFFNATNKKYCDIVDKHQKTESQEKNYLEWNEILKIYNQIMTKDNEQNKLLISFYILLPPRRIDDYRHLYLTKTKPRKMDNNKNYIVSSLVLYQVTSFLANISVHMTLARMLAVLLLSVTMCWLSGVGALKKLWQAEPASLF